MNHWGPTPARLTTFPSVTNSQLKALINQSVADALAASDTDRSRNGDDSHNSEMSSMEGCLRSISMVLNEWMSVLNIEICSENQCQVCYLPLYIQLPLQVENHVKTLVMIPLTELALLYGRMFPEESDKIEKYVGGLPDMIHRSMMASKPKTMQDAIEIATELIDKKITTLVERQAENKRKLDNNN
ncbi:hypothetical protein Tco_1274033 [Tanacetum coccineum]